MYASLGDKQKKKMVALLWCGMFFFCHCMDPLVLLKGKVTAINTRSRQAQSIHNSSVCWHLSYDETFLSWKEWSLLPYLYSQGRRAQWILSWRKSKSNLNQRLWPSHHLLSWTLVGGFGLTFLSFQLSTNNIKASVWEYIICKNGVHHFG